MSPITTLVTVGSLLAGAMASPLLNTTRASGHLDAFVETCNRWVVTQDGPDAWLEAYCKDKGGDQWHSVLNLNHCIVNSDGYMAPGPGGDFAASCHDMELLADSRLLAACDGRDGPKVSIFLNGFVNNDDGELICFGYRGCAKDSTGCDDKPPQK
ncbi:CVNH domain-containing protein [Whalleya microplaca]|nr:CVNH domain-containing protein [Whalleya microplaca]